MNGDTEAHFTTRVIQYARLCGWLVVHYRPARTAKGWATPLEGDRGCPDVILARNGQVLLIELKAKRGTLGPGQREWLDALGPHGMLCRPADEEALQEILR